jgi:hypothetical protein
MNKFEPDDDDVVWMKAIGKSPVRNLTFLVSQLISAFTLSIQRDLIDSPETTAKTWFGEGLECEIVDVSRGGGWKEGKIRLRLEFVPDEPEQNPNADFLDDLRKDSKPEQ